MKLLLNTEFLLWKKYKTSSRQFLDNILEALKPLTAGNIKDINVKNKIKELDIRNCAIKDYLGFGSEFFSYDDGVVVKK